MHAIRVHNFGPPDVLVYEEIPTPTPGPGQILIRVEAAAVNYADIMRRSDAPYPFPTSLPYIPGSEVAGVVAQPALALPVHHLALRYSRSSAAMAQADMPNSRLPPQFKCSQFLLASISRKRAV